MTDDTLPKTERAGKGHQPPKNTRREAKLAEALRANLRRRKAQAQARQDVPPGEPEPEGS